MAFGKSKFIASISILKTRYKHPENQNNNLFYPFNNQINYALADYFSDFETTKCNVNRFFTKLIIKPIIKNLSYRNRDKWIEKWFAIT